MSSTHRNEIQDSNQSGFTLIELLVGITMLGILIALGVPSLQDTIKRNRVEGEIQDLRDDLNFARGEAASKGKLVVICGANAALTDCSASGNWSNGWIVFFDEVTPSPYAASVVAGDEIIRTYRHSGTNTLKATQSDGVTAQTYLAYSPQGYIRGSQTAFLKACTASNEARYARGIVISPTGRALTTRDQDGDGIHEHVTDDGLGAGTSVASSALSCP